MESTDSETKLTFPKGFLIGAALSAHQAEGNNSNSDWWQYEQEGKLPKSGEACDHYNRFEEDFAMAQQIGLNAVRISIEWARIEPTQGKWNSTAIEHYRQVLQSMKNHGLTRMVTLWHWTLPKWLADKGGFSTDEGLEAFARFAWFVAQNLGAEVDLWVTLNEPELYALQAYKHGSFPPFIKSSLLTARINKNLIKAHKMAYQAIKSVNENAQVGIAKNSPLLKPYRPANLFDRIVAVAANKLNFNFLEKVRSELDFIGLNYYTHISIKFSWKHGYIDMNQNHATGKELVFDDPQRSEMGWLLYPQGIYEVFKKLKKYGKPIYVTESGIADGADKKRYDYIRTTLASIQQAISEGMDVRGFFYWSLIDNYEWTYGFGPRFGLIKIDYDSKKRTVRDSTRIFKEIETK